MENVDSYKIINTKKYCGPPGIDFLEIIRTKNSNPHNWPQMINRKTVFTHRGRTAIALICKLWNIGAKHEILAPSYNCGSEIDPLLKTGAVVKFYRVDQHAQLDFEDIQKRTTKRTKILYIIHYFGWPQKLRDIVEWCQSRNIYLVEDCALSLFSDPVNHPVGTLGDAAIYSFPKALPVPDGGALTIANNVRLKDNPTDSPSMKVICRATLPLIKRTVLRLADKIHVYSYIPQRFIQSRNKKKIHCRLTLLIYLICRHPITTIKTFKTKLLPLLPTLSCAIPAGNL